MVQTVYLRSVNENMAVMRTCSLSFKVGRDIKVITVARLKGFGIKIDDTKVCT